MRVVSSLASATLLVSAGRVAVAGSTPAVSIPLTPRETFLAAAIAAMIACALSSFFLAARVSERTHSALMMLVALIGAFCLLTLFGPGGGENSTLGAFVIVGLIALFKLMNQFEARARPGSPADGTSLFSQIRGWVQRRPRRRDRANG